MAQGSSPGGGGGAGNPSPGGGGAGAGYSYDSDAVEAELRYVGATLARVPRQQLSVQQAGALDAITRHIALLTLLRGSLPPGLVAPLPPGYVAHRVGALARGTCLDAFVWDGGDPQLWSPELPDDSSLVLYLVTSFLLCPGWNFTPDHAGLTAQGGAAVGQQQGMMGAAAAPAQMAGGIPLSHVEIARPADLGVGAGAVAAFTGAGTVATLIAGGGTAAVRYRIAELIAENEGEAAAHPPASVGRGKVP